MKGHTKKPPRERRLMSEEQLDEAIEDSFPASDPLPITPTHLGGPDRTGPTRGAAKAGRRGHHQSRDK
jgi:hypothetical protein